MFCFRSGIGGRVRFIFGHGMMLWLLFSALVTVSVPGVCVPRNGTDKAPDFMNYVLPTKGFDTEIVMINHDVMNANYAYSTLAIAYDKDGTELARKDISFATGSRLKMSLSEMFPSLENVDDIGFVQINSSNKNDVWVIYSNGDQKAMVRAPVEGSSVVNDLHFTSNTGYWQFFLNLAKVTADESSVRAVAYPGGEALAFDGSANPYDFVMPNLNGGMGAVSLNMADVFGGVVPADASWMQVLSEYVNDSPFGNTVTPVSNLIGNTVFMKSNGESGGAFGNAEAFEELIIPHIADQTANPDPSKRFFWTGLVLNNPHDEAVKAVIQFYSDTGVHLDVDPGTQDVDDYPFVLEPYGKKVDLISNFGMPEGAAFARVVADKPIMGGELFGGEPSGNANWPIMAGVGLLLPGTGGYLYSVTDINTPTLRYNIPLAESKAFTDTEEGVWTGVAFANLGKRNQTVVLQYKTETGLTVGTQNYTVQSMSKQAVTVEDLLNQAGLEDIRDQVAMMDVVAKQSLAPLDDNREVNIYALQGGLSAGTGAHSWMIGEDAVNISPVDVKMFVANETRGIVDNLKDMLGSMNLQVEDNDVILSHVIGTLRDTKYGEITGYDIVAYDDDWNKVGSLGGFRRSLHPDMSDKVYFVNFTSDNTVDSLICPYGTYKLGITVHVTDNGIEQNWTYRIPDKTITRVPEQDYDIDAIYANGGGNPAYQAYDNPARQITSDKLQELATILSQPGVLYGGGRQLTYQEAYDKIAGYLDGDEANDEMVNFKIFDFNEGVGNQVNFVMHRGPPDKAWTLPDDGTGEKLMEQLKDLYGVNNR